MWQAEHVQALLKAQGHSVSLLGMTTQGDRILDKALDKIGGKGLFVKELEEALADGRAEVTIRVRITDAVHRHGVPIFAQINHNGGQASSMYSRLPVWAPSPVADPLFREVPKAVSHTEIADIVAYLTTLK